jgi:tRNA-Thr(GGU) m(6)t(6)A37 methyltransferase TsaA
MTMRKLTPIVLATVIGGACSNQPAAPGDTPDEMRAGFTVYPIGYVRKDDHRTSIVLQEEYEPGLLGVDRLSHVWVLWWFDRNDTPEKRSILQVHPQGNLAKPLTGVFATHSPVRPNLIAMTRCKVVSVAENIIEIESIDAFPDTPVLDLKSG